MMKDLLAYSDGELDLLEIAERIQVPVDALFSLVEKLVGVGVLAAV